MIPHSKLREPNDNVVKFFKLIFPQVVKHLSLRPPSLVAVDIIAFPLSIGQCLLFFLFASCVMYQSSYRMLPCPDTLGWQDRHIPNSFFQRNAFLPDLASMMGVTEQDIPRITCPISPLATSDTRSWAMRRLHEFRISGQTPEITS